jgi:broad specificity phosphatase PhoE
MAWSSSSPASLLTLVRHGQASYLEGDTYDKLSTLGELQSRRLGEYWARGGISFDAVFRGPAQRHRRTEELAGEAYRQAGGNWPAAAGLPEFDEFPGEEVIAELTPILAERHPHIKTMAQAFEDAPGKEEKKRALDVLFHEVAQRWVAGEAQSPNVETWREFVGRVDRALAHIRESLPDGQRAVVFTSGGPTAVVTSLVLKMPPGETLDLCFSPRNASFSEFLLQDGAIYLSSFNSFPHLDDPALLTYR